MRLCVALGIAAAAAIGLVAATSAEAQAPPSAVPLSPPAAVPAPQSEAAAVAQCLCLHRDLQALAADMTARRRAYRGVEAQLSRIDAQLQQERATVDVNNPAALAQFRELLARRDALFQRSTGPEAGALAAAVARYNEAVEHYNGECANRPRDPRLVAQVTATLACPAP